MLSCLCGKCCTTPYHTISKGRVECFNKSVISNGKVNGYTFRGSNSFSFCLPRKELILSHGQERKQEVIKVVPLSQKMAEKHGDIPIHLKRARKSY